MKDHENEQKTHARHDRKDGGDPGGLDQAARAHGRDDEAQRTPQAHPAVLRARGLYLAQAKILGYRHEGGSHGGEESDQHEQGDKTARPPQEEREQRTRDGAREGHAAAQAELVRKRSEQGRGERARQTGRRVQQAELEPAHAYGMIKDVQEREHDAHGEKMQKIKRGHSPEGDCAGGLRAHGRARGKRGIRDLFTRAGKPKFIRPRCENDFHPSGGFLLRQGFAILHAR